MYSGDGKPSLISTQVDDANRSCTAGPVTTDRADQQEDALLLKQRSQDNIGTTAAHCLEEPCYGSSKTQPP
jgi:hypothetical protein